MNTPEHTKTDTPEEQQKPVAHDHKAYPAYPYPMHPGYPGYPRYGYGYGGYPDAQGYADPEDEGISILHLVRVFWRKKLTVILGLLLGIGCSVLYIIGSTPLYRANAIIQLSARRPRILSQQDVMADDGTRNSQADEVINTQLEKLRTGSFRNSVLELLKEKPIHSRRQRWIAPAVRGLEISPDRDSFFVTLSSLSASPELAADAVNTFAEQAEASVVDQNRKLSDSAVQWLENQARVQKQKLHETEEALLQCRRDNKVETLMAQRRTAEEALLAINQSLIAAETELIKAIELGAAIKRAGDDPEAIKHLPTAITEKGEINGALAEINNLEAARTTLLASFTEKHPDVATNTAELKNARKRLMDAMRLARANTTSDIALLKREVEVLKSRMETQRRVGAQWEQEIAEAQAKISSLERQRQIDEDNYQSILKRMSEARLAADENTSTIKIEEYATIPESPSKPRIPIVIALGCILGVGFGCGIVLLSEQFNRRIWDIESLARRARLDILSLVPLDPNDDRRHVARMMLDNKFSPVAESYAALRSELINRQAGKVILVSSTDPASGKTITASNLATAWSASGQRTLLIDLDFRRPRIGSLWGIRTEKQSLLHALTNEDDIDFKTLTHTPKMTNFDILASTHTSAINPADVLASKGTETLLAWAREHYDRVILDSPPLQGGADAWTLAALADTVVLVAMLNQTREQSLIAIVERLRNQNTNLMGLVLNGIRSLRGQYGYYGHYGAYGYGRPAAGEKQDAEEKERENS